MRFCQKSYKKALFFDIKYGLMKDYAIHYIIMRTKQAARLTYCQAGCYVSLPIKGRDEVLHRERDYHSSSQTFLLPSEELPLSPAYSFAS